MATKELGQKKLYQSLRRLCETKVCPFLTRVGLKIVLGKEKLKEGGRVVSEELKQETFESI